MAAKTSRVSRRRFLGITAASLAGPAIIPARARGADGYVAPSSRITLGFIGTGSHGIAMNLRNFLPQPDAQVVALCDVDQSRVEQALQVTAEHYAANRPNEAFSGCFTTRDWREIIDRPDIDAVVVSTPDHWHVIPSVAAARAGKDVLCEKPLTLTVHEGRVLSDTIRQYGRVFQTASENRSKANFLRAAELVRNGCLGKLHTIRTQLPVDETLKSANGKLHPPQPVPEGFDYDMWLGQAPSKPYTPGRCHYHFRWILDYSGGSLTDWGAHLNDVAQWANDTEYTGPISVDGQGTFPEEGLYNTATKWEIAFEYANGVTLICTDGSPLIRFEGAQGWIECEWNTIEYSSKDLAQAVIGPNDIHLRTCPGREQRDFLDCVKTRALTYAPAEVGHRSITLSHIGNISMMLGRKLRWDPERERFINDATANSMLSRTMRSPWTL